MSYFQADIAAGENMEGPLREALKLKPSLNGDGVHGDKEAGALARWRPWNERSMDLAVHLEKHWVVRTDVFGYYYTDDAGDVCPATSKNVPLTQGILLRHCRARKTDEVIGAHTTVWMPVEGLPGVGASVCRQAQADIDWHGDGPPPEANLGAALAWRDRAAELGFRPLLLDSNGKGGFRLVVIFDEPITARHSRQFMRWLTRDWKGLGLAEAVECFPKQDSLNPPGSRGGDKGNWLRLPGRHHKRDHWTRVYSDGECLEGDDAIDAILDYVGDSPQLIPDEAIQFDPEPRAAGDPRARVRTDRELEGDAALAKEALGWLKPGVKDAKGREYLTDYDHWLRIGMALHELGDDGFGLWCEWSALCSAKYDEEVCTYKWGTFRDDGEKRVRLGTLFAYAKGAGWDGPRKAGKRPRLSNFITVKVDGGKEGETRSEPRGAPDIADYLEKITGDDGTWPKRVDEILFVEGAGYRPTYLQSSTQFFGWLDGFASVYWLNSVGMIGQERFFEYVRKFRAERFRSIEQYPHSPAMAGAYYMHPEIVRTRDKSHVNKLLDFFAFDSAVDRSLSMAAILTLFWGGSPGGRPCFRIEGPADDPPELMRRHVGKTTFVEVLGSLCGGILDLEEGEDIPDVKTRLLSEEGMGRRVLRIDNVKTMRMSWAALEHFITSDVISGKRLYCGEGSRPNTVTVFITINGGTFSKDMATRVVPIRLKRPTPDGDWRRRVTRFIEEHRWNIIAEIVGILSDARGSIAARGRWAEWQAEVLGKVAGYPECQAEIEKRIGELDDDDADALDIEDFIAEKLKDRLHRPDEELIKIPVKVMGEWYSEREREDIKAKTATERLELKPLKRLKYKRTNKERFWLWSGEQAAGEPVGLLPDPNPPEIRGFRRRAYG